MTSRACSQPMQAHESRARGSQPPASGALSHVSSPAVSPPSLAAGKGRGARLSLRPSHPKGVPEQTTRRRLSRPASASVSSGVCLTTRPAPSARAARPGRPSTRSSSTPTAAGRSSSRCSAPCWTKPPTNSSTTRGVAMLSALRHCGLWLAICGLSLLYLIGAVVTLLFGLIADAGLGVTEWARSTIRAARRWLA